MSGVPSSTFSTPSIPPLPAVQAVDEEKDPLEEREIRILNLFQSVSKERLQEFTDFMPWFTREKKYVFKGPKSEQEERVRKINALLTGFLGLTAEDPAYLHKAHRVFREECVNWVSEAWKGKTLSEKFADMTTSFEAKHDALGRLKLNEIKTVYLTPKFNLEKLDEMYAFTENYYSKNMQKPSKDAEIHALAKPLIDSVMNYYYGGVEYKKHLGKQHLPQKICAAKLALLVNNNERFEEVFNGICNQHIKGWKELHIDEKTQKELLELFIYSIKDRKGITPSLALSQVQHALKLLTLFNNAPSKLLSERISLLQLVIDQLQLADPHRTKSKEIESLLIALLKQSRAIIPDEQKILAGLSKQQEKAKRKSERHNNDPGEGSPNQVLDNPRHPASCPYEQKIRMLRDHSTTFSSIIHLVKKAIDAHYISYLPPLIDAIPSINPLLHDSSAACLIGSDLERIQKKSLARDQAAINYYIKKFTEIIPRAERDLMILLEPYLHLFPSEKKGQINQLAGRWKKQKAQLDVALGNLMPTAIESLIKNEILLPYRRAMTAVLKEFDFDEQKNKLALAGLLNTNKKGAAVNNYFVNSFLETSDTLIDQPDSYRTMLVNAINEINANDIPAFDKTMRQISDKVFSHQAQRLPTTTYPDELQDFPMLAIDEMLKAYATSKNCVWLKVAIQDLAICVQHINLNQEKVQSSISKAIQLVYAKVAKKYTDPVFKEIMVLILTELGLKKSVLSQLLNEIPHDEGQPPFRYSLLEQCMNKLSSEAHVPISLKEGTYYREKILKNLTLIYLKEVDHIEKVDLACIHQVINYLHLSKDNWVNHIEAICKKLSKLLERSKKDVKRIEDEASLSSDSEDDDSQPSVVLIPWLTLHTVKAICAIGRLLFTPPPKAAHTDSAKNEDARRNGALLVKPLLNEDFVPLNIVQEIISDYFSYPLSANLLDIEDAFDYLLVFTSAIHLFDHPDSEKLNSLIIDFLQKMKSKITHAVKFNPQDYHKILEPFGSHFIGYSEQLKGCVKSQIIKPIEGLLKNYFGHRLSKNTREIRLALMKRFFENAYRIKEIKNSNILLEDHETVRNVLECGYWLSQQFKWEKAIPTELCQSVQETHKKIDFRTYACFELLRNPCEIILNAVDKGELTFDEKIQSDLFDYIHHLLAECYGAYYLYQDSSLANSFSKLRELVLKLINASSSTVKETKEICRILNYLVQKDISLPELELELKAIYDILKKEKNRSLWYLVQCSMNEKMIDILQDTQASRLDELRFIIEMQLQFFALNQEEIEINTLKFISTLVILLKMNTSSSDLDSCIERNQVFSILCSSLIQCAESVVHSHPDKLGYFFDQCKKMLNPLISKLDNSHAIFFLQIAIGFLIQWPLRPSLSPENKRQVWGYILSLSKLLQNRDPAHTFGREVLEVLNEWPDEAFA